MVQKVVPRSEAVEFRDLRNEDFANLNARVKVTPGDITSVGFAGQKGRDGLTRVQRLFVQRDSTAAANGTEKRISRSAFLAPEDWRVAPSQRFAESQAVSTRKSAADSKSRLTATKNSSSAKPDSI